MTICCTDDDARWRSVTTRRGSIHARTEIMFSGAAPTLLLMPRMISSSLSPCATALGLGSGSVNAEMTIASIFDELSSQALAAVPA